MGRPSKFTPEITEKVLQNIRLGMRYKDAALAAGVSDRTFAEWRQKGEKAKSGKYSRFSQSLHLAEAEGERALIARIQSAAKKQWQAAAWILERRHRERWGRNLDVTTKGDAVKGYAIFSPDDWEEDDCSD